MSMNDNSLSTENIQKLQSWLTEQVIRALETGEAGPNGQNAREVLQAAYVKSKVSLSAGLRKQLFENVLNGVMGFGEIQPLLDDPDVTEIMINGPKQVYIERSGKLVRSGIVFQSDADVLRLIDRIILPLGRRIDAESPTVDARLPDGSRVNAVIPPVAIDGPSITIRKFAKERLVIDDLIRFNSITQNMAQFLEACVVSHLNIIVSGGTGSGKTTLLNILSEYIPEEERIVTIEDAAELQLHQEHVVRLETKPPNLEGTGAVPIRHLVRNSLRMRPDRIIVGEVRGGEAIDMLQAMNTGHDGSMTTLHANSPRDAISRLETMSLQSGLDLPLRVVREQIAAAVDLVVQQARLRDGSRKVVAISEIVGMEGDTVVMSDIFKFEEAGLDDDGNVRGELKPTGLRPMFGHRLEAAGFKLGPEVFGADLISMRNPRR